MNTEPDRLKNTRKLVEIAENAAQFQSVIIPLNSADDIEAFAELMELISKG